MSNPQPNEQNPALVRFLKIAVIGMGILILAGLTAVIWRIVTLASSPKDAPPAVTSAAPLSAAPSAALPPEAMLALPDGATVRSVALSANRLAVHYWAPSGSGIAIMDLEIRPHPDARPPRYVRSLIARHRAAPDRSQPGDNCLDPPRALTYSYAH